MSQLFTSGGQSIGVSASASVLPMNTQDYFPLGWTGWISLQSKGHHSSKASIFRHSAFLIVQLSHSYVTTGKTTALTRRTFVGKLTSLLFNVLSGLVISFPYFMPKSRHMKSRKYLLSNCQRTGKEPSWSSLTGERRDG